MAGSTPKAEGSATSRVHIVYQPVVHTEDHRIVAAEALAPRGGDL